LHASFSPIFAETRAHIAIDAATCMPHQVTYIPPPPTFRIATNHYTIFLSSLAS